MSINKWIDDNREIIDELTGENAPIYTAILLKGKILNYMNKKEALELFAEIMKSCETQNEQNVRLRQLLVELRQK